MGSANSSRSQARRATTEPEGHRRRPEQTSEAPRHLITTSTTDGPKASTSDSNKTSASSPVEYEPRPRTKIKCPSCKVTLVAPPHQIFSCPCGQVLLNPKAGKEVILANMSSSNPSGMRIPQCHFRVRCPRCLTFCDIPPSTVLVPCGGCGLHLKHPEGDFAMESNDFEPVSDAAARQSRRFRKASAWRHRKVTSEKLGWKRIWSEAELFQVMQREGDVLDGLNEAALNDLSEGELQERLSRCLVNVSGSHSKEDLVKLVLRGVEDLSTQLSESALRLLLEDRYLDHSSCFTRVELASRLFAFEWSRGETAREEISRTKSFSGFVRCFISENPVSNDEPSATQNLEASSAATFIISTRLGSELPGSLASIQASEVIQIGSFAFKEKTAWLEDQIDRLRVPWEKGHVRIRIRRSHLLEDSFNAFLQLEPSDMQRFFRFEFLNERGHDAGGVAREWFQLIVEECFNPSLGLFELADTGNVIYQIAPSPVKQSSSTIINEEVALRYYRFMGRVLGKAIFDGHHVAAHFARVVYKHILACPISEDDLETLDESLANSSKAVRECPDVSDLALNFTMAFADARGGSMEIVELAPGGKGIDVTNDNREEYLQLRLKHIALVRIAPHLKELLIGVYESIPFVLLSVFTPVELELLICGTPGTSP